MPLPAPTSAQTPLEATHELVRRLRLARGLTQAELGVHADLSHNTIGLIERTPGYVPGSRVKRRLARALGVSIQQLWPAEVRVSRDVE